MTTIVVITPPRDGFSGRAQYMQLMPSDGNEYSTGGRQPRRRRDPLVAAKKSAFFANHGAACRVLLMHADDERVRFARSLRKT